MIYLIVIGSAIVVALALAALYDHRARRHGWRAGVTTAGARASRLDVEAGTLEPIVRRDDRD
jgi:hypothetical protein